MQEVLLAEIHEMRSYTDGDSAGQLEVNVPKSTCVSKLRRNITVQSLVEIRHLSVEGRRIADFADVLPQTLVHDPKAALCESEMMRRNVNHMSVSRAITIEKKVGEGKMDQTNGLFKCVIV
jgi:hypothetical protein